MGKGSVYRQFGSKEGLYAAAIIAGFRQLRNQIERALEEERSFPDRIAAIVRHILSSVWDRGDFFVLHADPSTILPSAAARQYRRESQELSSLISQVLREGAAAGWIRGDLNFQLVAESILGMIRGVPTLSQERGYGRGGGANDSCHPARWLSCGRSRNDARLPSCGALR